MKNDWLTIKWVEEHHVNLWEDEIKTILEIYKEFKEEEGDVTFIEAITYYFSNYRFVTIPEEAAKQVINYMKERGII